MVGKWRPRDRRVTTLRNPSLTDLTLYSGTRTWFNVTYLKLQWHLPAKYYRYAMENIATENIKSSLIVAIASTNIVVLVVVDSSR
jgi:hypothetical protein